MNINDRFTRLTAIEKVSAPSGKAHWAFLCDCGKRVVRRADSVKSGKTKSCGCLQKETRSSRMLGVHLKDISGQRFGMLTAIEHQTDNGNRDKWLFGCDCGNTHIARTSHVKAGLISSCGCLEPKPLSHGHTMGLKTSPEYNSWQAMRSRCNNPNHMAFKNYGGRGIKVCPEWQSSFEAFLRDMGNRPEGTTLDRINTGGSYEPHNCKWSTWVEQQNNRRNTGG